MSLPPQVGRPVCRKYPFPPSQSTVTNQFAQLGGIEIGVSVRRMQLPPQNTPEWIHLDFVSPVGAEPGEMSLHDADALIHDANAPDRDVADRPPAIAS